MDIEQTFWFGFVDYSTVLAVLLRRCRSAHFYLIDIAWFLSIFFSCFSANGRRLFSVAVAAVRTAQTMERKHKFRIRMKYHWNVAHVRAPMVLLGYFVCSCRSEDTVCRIENGEPHAEPYDHYITLFFLTVWHSALHAVYTKWTNGTESSNTGTVILCHCYTVTTQNYDPNNSYNRTTYSFSRDTAHILCSSIGHHHKLSHSIDGKIIDMCDASNIFASHSELTNIIIMLISTHKSAFSCESEYLCFIFDLVGNLRKASMVLMVRCSIKPTHGPTFAAGYYSVRASFHETFWSFASFCSLNDSQPFVPRHFHTIMNRLVSE